MGRLRKAETEESSFLREFQTKVSLSVLSVSIMH